MKEDRSNDRRGTVAKQGGWLNRPDVLPRFILMTDDRPGVDWAGAIRRLPAGSAVIVRHPEFLVRCRIADGLASHAAANGVYLLLAMERPVRIAGIDGVHIPENALVNWRAADLRRAGHALVTVAAHSAAAVARAGRLGADAALLSPVFPTKSHPGAMALGMARFERIARAAPVPVYALGGIGPDMLTRLGTGAAQGVAGIGLFFDPAFARMSGRFRAIGV